MERRMNGIDSYSRSTYSALIIRITASDGRPLGHLAQILPVLLTYLTYLVPYPYRPCLDVMVVFLVLVCPRLLM